MKASFRLLCMLLLAVVLMPGAAAAGKSAPAPSLPLQEGREYVTIPDGHPYAANPGRIEVAEVFSYRCPHCAHFAPQLEAWKRRQAKDVQLVYVPLASDRDDMLSRGFLVTSDAKALEKIHLAVFKALHQDQSLPGNPSADEMADFLARHGLRRADTLRALNQDALSQRLMAARQFAMRSGIDGTPTLIVNGRYRVLGQSSVEATLRVVDALVARERQAARTP